MHPLRRKGITSGVMSGMTWGIYTVIIGVAMAMSPLSEYTIFAPIIAQAVNDLFSFLWMLLYTGWRKNFPKLISILKNKNSLIIVAGAICGGPIALTCYVMSIKYLGSSYAAILSTTYPAVGAVFAFLFLKERMRPLAILGLGLVISAAIALGLSSPGEPENVTLGLIFGVIAVIGLASEGTILAYGMKQDIAPDIALQIRQGTSAFVNIVVVICLGQFIDFTKVFASPVVWLLVITAFAGTVSYLFYYTAINTIGMIQAMGLNISYSGWAVFFGLFAGVQAGFKEIVLAILIFIGSILTTDNPKEFLDLFKKDAPLPEGVDGHDDGSWTISESHGIEPEQMREESRR